MSSTPTSLPSPRELLTSILNALSAIPPPPDNSPRAQDPNTTTNDPAGATAPTRSSPTNPLRSLAPAHRPLLTTLHVLFPSQLLPALDLLDRGLVAGLTRGGDDDDDDDVTAPAVYLVRSSAHHRAPRSAYVVHAAAWHCTCAAFAFSAFPARAEEEEEEDGGGGGGGGGLPPCCKHLLACVLAERWGAVLGRYVRRRTVGREEMAGIFAGI